MKKIILCAVIALTFVSESQAFRIGGFHFSWQRGKPEWNADKTDTRCVGKGMCTGKIGFDVDIKVAIQITPDGQEEFDSEGNTYSGNLVRYKDGLAIEFSQQYYNTYRQDFDGGTFQLNSNLEIDQRVSRILGYQGGHSFSSGSYQFIKDPQTGALLVILE